jgi:hypothetical protein
MHWKHFGHEKAAALHPKQEQQLQLEQNASMQ